jgi:hypothetical protein
MASLFKQVIQWLLSMTRLFFTTRLGKTIWSFFPVLCIVFIVPIVFHSFYKSIYDLGPKHCKQSFWEILTQPVPGIEFEGRLGESAILFTNAGLITSLLIVNFIETRFFHQSSLLITRSMTTLVHDCPMTNIDCDAPHLYGYQTYTTSNDASVIGNHLDQSPHTVQMTLYFAICHFSCPDLVFKTLPCHPPDGFITEGFAIFIILVIFGIITLPAWIWLINLSSRQFLQRLILREICTYHTKN